MKNPFRGVRRSAPISGMMSNDKDAPDVERKSAPLIALQLGGSAHWTPREFSTLAREGYHHNPVAYRCVRMISEAAASVPICARRQGECLADDPAVRFLSRGDGQHSAIEIMEQFYGYLQLGGTAYFHMIQAGEVPVALRAISPDPVTCLTDRAGRARGYEIETSSGRQHIRRDAVTGQCAIYRLSLFNPLDRSRGMSPLDAAAQAVDLHNQGARWAKSLLDNSARPSGALVYSNPTGERLNDEQFERLKSELEHQHSGPDRAGRPMVLEGGLDWKSMSMSPTDMDFIKARQQAARDIALAFGVPPMLLGIPGDNSYANYAQANQAFWRQTIVPLVRKTAAGFENWLRPWFGDDLNIRADLDDVPALAEERAVLWSRLDSASFITDTERRALAGLPTGEASP